MAKRTQSKETGKPRKPKKVGKRKGAGKVLTATDEDFDRRVAAAGGPVLVDLWATWCGPCLALSPVLDELAVEFADRLTVIKVDIDQSPEIGRPLQGAHDPQAPTDHGHTKTEQGGVAAEG